MECKFTIEARELVLLMSTKLLDTVVQENPERFHHPTCIFLREYWERQRGTRPMPARSDISPAQMKHHLGWVSLLEVMPGEREFRHRLVGTLIAQYFFVDSTGKTMTEAFAPAGDAIAQAVNRVFRKVARDKVVMRVAGNADWLAPGMEEYEAIYLPLSEDGVSVSHILNAFTCDLEKMLLARQIAKANGGQLLRAPKAKAG